MELVYWLLSDDNAQFFSQIPPEEMNVHCIFSRSFFQKYTYLMPGLSNAAPVIYFSGALIYSAGFNVIQNFKEKIFLNNSMFQVFS
jgi:hypothetical protein